MRSCLKFTQWAAASGETVKELSPCGQKESLKNDKIKQIDENGLNNTFTKSSIQPSLFCRLGCDLIIQVEHK